MFTQQKQRAENAESEQCGKPAVPQKLADEFITVRKQLDLDGLFFAETRVDCACAADNHLAKGLCSIGRTKTKSGRAETDKSKLNRKRVIELPEKVPAKCFKTV